MRPILALATLPGPPAECRARWVKTRPSTSEVSSMVPPSFLTTAMSFRSTLVAVAGSMTLRMASTASGARMSLLLEMTFELSEVVAALISSSRSARSTGMDMLCHRKARRRRVQPRWVRPELWRGAGWLRRERPGCVRAHLQDLLRLPGGEQKGLRDDGGVDALLEQDLRLVQQRAGDDGHRRRAVTCLHVLRLGQVDEHLGGGVSHLHLLQNCRPVVGDDHLILGRGDLRSRPRGQAW